MVSRDGLSDQEKLMNKQDQGLNVDSMMNFLSQKIAYRELKVEKLEEKLRRLFRSGIDKLLFQKEEDKDS